MLPQAHRRRALDARSRLTRRVPRPVLLEAWPGDPRLLPFDLRQAFTFPNAGQCCSPSRTRPRW
jgi:hypothetical protein